MLLPSGPDMVHKTLLPKTLISTLHLIKRLKEVLPEATVRLCYSGLQMQGTAGSPPSTVFIIIIQIYQFCKDFFNIQAYQKMLAYESAGKPPPKSWKQRSLGYSLLSH